MLPIAHRGLWFPTPQAQNTIAALTAAVQAGFAIELDPRLHGRDLVLQHDLADSPHALTPAQPDVLTLLARAPLVFWDLKARDVEEPLLTFLATHHLEENAVLFDYELYDPTARNRLVALKRACGSTVRLLTRVSERNEPLYVALGDDAAVGIWLDQFDSLWFPPDLIKTIHAAGKLVYVVSPELHGRALDLAAWQAWADAGADGLCTDFPHLLASLAPQTTTGPTSPMTPFRPAGWHAAA